MGGGGMVDSLRPIEDPAVREAELALRTTVLETGGRDGPAIGCNG
jgi:hypothetical protein